MRFAPFVLAAFPIVAAACSSSSPSTPAGNGPVARFNYSGATPSFMEVPFPSDVYLANGHLIEVPGVENVFRQSASYLTKQMPVLDGFSRVAMSLFYIDDPAAPQTDDGDVGAAAIDATSLPVDEKACTTDSSSVFLLDVADPTKRIPCRAAFHHDLSIKARSLVAVGPARGIVLEEGHQYVAVLTSRIKDKKGQSIGHGPDFNKLLQGGDDPVYKKPLDAAKTGLAAALATDNATIVAIAPYTTNAMTKELFDLREQLEDAPAATLKWDDASMAPMGATKFAAGATAPAGFTATLDDWLGVVDPAAKLPDGTDDPDSDLPVRAHDKIAAFGTAVFDAINYLQVKPTGYDDVEHATFARKGGKIVPAPEAPTAKIWVSIAIPTATMPASGYPVVIVQHGLSGSREYLPHLMNTFCKNGWAVVAIDSVTFGARSPHPQNQVDKVTDYQSAPGAKYKGPDGISDADANGNRNGSTDLFGGLKNIGSIRDQFRQAEFDTAQLVKLVRGTPDLSPLALNGVTPKFDGSKVAYFGDSLGGIQGAAAAAIEPNVKSWALNVAGGGLLVELAAHSPSIGALLNLAAGANFGLVQNSLNESHPLTNVLQLLVEAGDPLAYANLLITKPRTIKGAAIPPRNIFQIEVVYDELVPNEANEALARAGGWGFATPNVGSNSVILDYKNFANDHARVPLPDVMPDAMMSFHDTPVMGATAILVQVSPGQHGSDFVAGTGKRQFGIPYGNFETPEPFPHLDFGKEFKVPCPYRELQAGVIKFFDGTFNGMVPQVSGMKAPVRDVDADGALDDVDADPTNPNVK